MVSDRLLAEECTGLYWIPPERNGYGSDAPNAIRSQTTTAVGRPPESVGASREPGGVL